ncbi:uncharacterized protein LOC141691989 [Apium graveolens]|uniref:uncharacterized protein LOC141691989 n=1 Tax=Apium graveolens TaxID=4045 RepID=UPI003D7AC195
MDGSNHDWINHRLQNDRITLTTEYKKGVDKFVDVATKFGLVRVKTKCPYVNCKNLWWQTIDDATFHLYVDGFLPNYNIWNCHGEKDPRREFQRQWRRRRTIPIDVEPPVDINEMLRDVVDQDYYSFNDIAGTSTQNAEQPPNSDAYSFYTDVNTCGAPIYLGNKDYAKLSFSTRLLHFKNVSKYSEKAFNLLLEIIGGVLPKKHTLPITYYEIKKMVKKLKLDYEKIDVCENDCMLFYGNDSKKIVCDVCNRSRYKDNKEKNGKNIPRKILRYFPFIHHLQRLFMSNHTAKYMTWYKNREVKKGKLSHPADGDEWKIFDMKYPSFAKEFRNVRLGLSSDGFNPFGNSGNNVYTLWPIVVVVFNLPPSMCMKRPFMFMTLLIPGLNSPTKDQNVFLRPLMDELYILWQSGVKTNDQSLKQNFNMKETLLWTISDFPGLGMLGGWSTKGKIGCSVCVGDVKGFQLRNETVYNVVHRYEIVMVARDEPILEVFAYPIQSSGKQVIGHFNDKDLKIVEYYVLLNMPELQPYIREYDAHVCETFSGVSDEQLDSLQKSEFKYWFRQKIENDNAKHLFFKNFIDGPIRNIFSFRSCTVNGYKFHINDGVLVKGTTHNNAPTNYYGKLVDIIKLVYGGGNFVYLFKYHWFNNFGIGVQVDKNRVVTIDIKSRLRSDEVFVLASQAIQVYYAPSVLNPRSNMFTVVNCKNSSIDETIYEPNDDAFQENVSNASSSSLFIDFSEYEPTRIVRNQNFEEEKEEEDEEEKEVIDEEGDSEAILDAAEDYPNESD